MIVMSDHGREQKNLGRDHVIRCAFSQRSVYPLRVPSRVFGYLAHLTSLIFLLRYPTHDWTDVLPPLTYTLRIRGL
jgi:hypothetical protein